MPSQQTVAEAANLRGIGLHTGVPVNVRLTPAAAHRGILFKRTDLDGFEIEARAQNVARVSYATSLMKKGVLISTTEHLLSALAACGVDNVCIEIDNLEVPIVDGSALPFVRLIETAGLRRQRSRRSYARILKTVEISEGAKRIAIHPADRFHVTYRIAFPHPAIGEQEYRFDPARAPYGSEIAPARTFGFLDEVETLRKNGLVRGGSLANVVVLNRDGVMNPEGLRFPDEFCRHKVLDLLGDLAMLGHPLLGHVVAERAGHALHFALVSQLLRDRSAWTLVTSTEPSRLTASASVPEPAGARVAAPSE